MFETCTSRSSVPFCFQDSHANQPPRAPTTVSDHCDVHHKLKFISVRVTCQRVLLVDPTYRPCSPCSDVLNVRESSGLRERRRISDFPLRVEGFFKNQLRSLVISSTRAGETARSVGKLPNNNLTALTSGHRLNFKTPRRFLHSRKPGEASDEEVGSGGRSSERYLMCF